MPFSIRQLKNLTKLKNWAVKWDGYEWQVLNKPDGLTWTPAWPEGLDDRARALEIMYSGVRNVKRDYRERKDSTTWNRSQKWLDEK